MKYIDEFRDKALVHKMAAKIREISSKPVRFMEVCGGHTMSVHKFGIQSMLPPDVELVSGPGCPVCVTSRKFIDHAVALAKKSGLIITTYGDLIRVPGSTSSLEKEKASGANVILVYSTLEALNIAVNNPDKKVVFLGIGFETTIPSTAVVILEAAKRNVNNFFVLSSHKIMPPAMEALIDEGVNISGYIAPGHVSTVAGVQMYRPVSEKYKIPVVVSGFEPVDILLSIYMLMKQHQENIAKVEVQYTRTVKDKGNFKALQIMNEVFKTRDDWWRGLGVLKKSGMAIREPYERFDAEKQFDVTVEPMLEPKGCICGEILKGLKKPRECALYANQCTPEFPIGACMVSGEGACQAYYKYNRYA